VYVRTGLHDVARRELIKGLILFPRTIMQLAIAARRNSNRQAKASSTHGHLRILALEAQC